MTERYEVESSGLTEGQKDCLRLVNEHHTSKEIARILGISPFTVDQRLDAARAKLNAESRKDAARLFALMETDGIYEPLVYQPEAVANGPKAGSPATLPAGNGAQFKIGLPPLGGQRHRLSKKEVLVQSLNVAFFSALAVAMLALIITGSMRLLS